CLGCVGLLCESPSRSKPPKLYAFGFAAHLARHRKAFHKRSGAELAERPPPRIYRFERKRQFKPYQAQRLCGIEMAVLIVEQPAMHTSAPSRSRTRKSKLHTRSCRASRTWSTAIALLACLGLTGSNVALGQGSAPGEYQMKAAFLFHFAQFVEWPPDAFKDSNSPLNYCTVGVDPFRGVL